MNPRVQLILAILVIVVLIVLVVYLIHIQTADNEPPTPVAPDVPHVQPTYLPIESIERDEPTDQNELTKTTEAVEQVEPNEQIEPNERTFHFDEQTEYRICAPSLAIGNIHIDLCTEMHRTLTWSKNRIFGWRIRYEQEQSTSPIVVRIWQTRCMTPDYGWMHGSSFNERVPRLWAGAATLDRWQVEGPASFCLIPAHTIVQRASQSVSSNQFAIQNCQSGYYLYLQVDKNNTVHLKMVKHLVDHHHSEQPDLLDHYLFSFETL